jgi:two-component system, cell cycle sensor histidine kinase and response regulator CckA
VKALIVDDREDDRRLLRYNLQWHGYQVVEAGDGQQALELARRERPDLIIADALMPVMDGFQLLREIKKDPALDRIPFIFYSSVYTGEREEELALSLGAQAYITKPKDADQIWEEISRISAAGLPPLAAPPPAENPDDEVFLIRYSQIVATKLEEKVRELEEANRGLTLSERRYRNLFASMRDAVIITDLSRTVIDVNQPALRDILGYQTGEVLGQSTALFYADPADFEMVGREVFRLQSQPDRLIELKLRRKSGEVFDAEIYALKMLGDDGQPTGNIGVIRDITERKQSAEKLARSEAEFRRVSQEFHLLLDAIPDSLMLIDRQFRVVWANKAAARAVGATPEALAGRLCYELGSDRSGPCPGCPAEKTLISGEPVSESLTASDGRVWDIQTAPLLDESGAVSCVIEVKRDVTEHKRLEVQYLQAQKMESIGTLAGGVAHDFNNILTAIIGYGQLAQMKLESDHPLRLNIDGILNAAERAAHLTKDLLLFSRKQVNERKPVDLNEIVANSGNFLQRIIRDDVTLKCVLIGGALPVLADRHQLGQVLMNLAVNACDAMPGGGDLILQTQRTTLGESFVQAQGHGKPGSYALLTTSDTGEGFDETTRQHIFEPFFTTKEVGRGTGLGLAVVYGIVNQHDGFITVHSEPGRGTTFNIYLPLLSGSLQEGAGAVQDRTLHRGSETILLAEDDALVRTLMSTVLAEAGYTVIEAIDGSDAVQKFRERPVTIDLLLFDVVMPRMSGKDAYDEIAREWPGTRVIFASGYAPDLARQQASSGEGINLVSKPVAPRELLRVVRRVLDGGT